MRSGVWVSRTPPGWQVPQCALRAGLPHWTRAGAGEPAGGTPRTGPADRVVVVAEEPLDAPGHGHVVWGRSGAVPGNEGHGHAPAPDADERLATGDRGVEGDAADEPRRDAEVVEAGRSC